jgi:3-hydroxyisobutyrate dehydrogenase
MVVGFVGLGVMGRPMALNLLRSGTDLVVWNRSPAAAEELGRAGARVAADVGEVFAAADVVLLMLASGEVLDTVLGRHTPRFDSLVADRTVVPMGTMSPDFSVRLARDVGKAGGRYAEAPVSGSRPVAEAAQLVVMLAGDEPVRAAVSPVLRPMGRAVVETGGVGSALVTKLAVNLFLITQVTGLVEAFHFASEHGLDLDTFRRVVEEGPMVSTVARAKLAKLLDGDYAVQAGTADVLMNAELIVAAGRRAGLATPVVDVCRGLFAEAVAAGWGDLDMAVVLEAVRERSRACRVGAATPG